MSPWGSRECAWKTWFWSAVEPMPEEGHWPEAWGDFGLPDYPEEDCREIARRAAAVYGGPYREEFAAACRDFYLYRYLHWRSGWPEGVLLGDYYFSLFSQQLIPLDSVALTEAFSDYLADNTAAPLCLEDYLEFMEQLKGVMEL